MSPSAPFLFGHTSDDLCPGESQKAFNLLQKRLKPLEHYQPVPYDFYNLCYLTSASTVHDAPAMRDWGGVGPEREKLVAMWRELTEVRSGEVGSVSGSGAGAGEGVLEKVSVAPGRLVELLRQAAAWQVHIARKKGRTPWTVTTWVKA